MQPTCLRVIFHLLSTMDIPVPSLKLTVHPWKLAKTPKWSRIVGSFPFPIQFQVLLLMEKIMHQLIRVRRASRKPGPGPGPSPDRTGPGPRQVLIFLILTCWELGKIEHFWGLASYISLNSFGGLAKNTGGVRNIKPALVFQPQKKLMLAIVAVSGLKPWWTQWLAGNRAHPLDWGG